ncbi:MAG: hypothetical protein E7437_07220 [Ruminococcaceae bacterium]|nr:hypothetical protein [Oscillospiraceae bacterium]
MEPIYRKEFLVDTIHLDCFGRLKPSVLLYFAQEAAGGHCLQLGTDWDSLQKKHLFWALIRTSVQITRLPGAGETVTVETWPMPTTRTAYPRATVGYDQAGQELFRSVSLWVLMDTHTRAMVLPGRSGVEISGVVRGNELAAPRSLPPQTLSRHDLRTVRFSQLDRNGHMNNTRYMDWVDDLLPAAFHQVHPVRGFTLCYLSEAREDQQIRLDFDLDAQGALVVDAHRENTDVPTGKERVFAARVEF